MVITSDTQSYSHSSFSPSQIHPMPARRRGFRGKTRGPVGPPHLASTLDTGPTAASTSGVLPTAPGFTSMLHSAMLESMTLELDDVGPQVRYYIYD